jgi:protein TonB
VNRFASPITKLLARIGRADIIVVMRNGHVIRRLMLGALVLVVADAHTLLITDAHAQAPVSTSQTSTDTPWPPAGVYRVARGIVAPRVIKAARPTYPPEAMRAKVQGRVLLEAVVQADGTVGEVRVRRSLDRTFGVDAAAVKAVKEMRFAPATKDGVAVPVLTSMELSFAAK